MGIEKTADVTDRRSSDARQLARDFGLQVFKFVERYGLAMAALVISAVMGWNVANSVSDYTKGGWETHIVHSPLGIDIHLHHWYYGGPLGLLALLLIQRNTTLSIFLFGLGAALSTHSYVNEGGIPSLFENGETLIVPSIVYLPAVTLISVLYAVFLIRREEWLSRAREREEIAMSYLIPLDKVEPTLGRLKAWANVHFHRRKEYRDRWTNIHYGYCRTPDRELSGEWQLHYVCSPFDEYANLLVVKLQHLPMSGRKGTLDEWLEEINLLLKPDARLALIEDRMATFAVTISAAQAVSDGGTG